MLSSASPAPIASGGGGDGAGEGEGGGGDAEAVSAQQARLWLLAPRTAALALGRGAFTMGTRRAEATESLVAPRLTFAGCLPAQRNATVELDLGSSPGGEAFCRWPEFHNGAAAGLALAAADANHPGLTRSWIVFNLSLIHI